MFEHGDILWKGRFTALDFEYTGYIEYRPEHPACVVPEGEESYFKSIGIQVKGSSIINCYWVTALGPDFDQVQISDKIRDENERYVHLLKEV